MTSKIYKNRLPAEWEDYDAVMMAWPHSATDWAYMLHEVQGTVVDIVLALVNSGVRVIIVTPDVEEASSLVGGQHDGKVIYFEVSTNDTWTRDYGVITCVNCDGTKSLCDFKFNGWGLKFAADKDNLVTRHMVESKLLKGTYNNHLGFVLEGGSIESDGCGTILTTSECLLSLNRNGDLSREEIDERLKSYFGVDRIFWLDYGYLAGDDTDSHIDTLARLVSEDTIMYVKCDDPDDEHYDELKKMEDQLMTFTRANGEPYHLIGLPMPDPVFDADGCRLPATYANFLITPGSILLPVYNQPKKDLLARQMMQIVFHDRDIIPIDCRTLIQQHGSLHCMTMQIPHGVVSC